jgi:hypothetical protein
LGDDPDAWHEKASEAFANLPGLTAESLWDDGKDRGVGDADDEDNDRGVDDSDDEREDGWVECIS